MSADNPPAVTTSFWKIPAVELANLVGIYSVMFVYGRLYEYFFAVQLTPLFHNDFTVYDASRVATYRLVECLTPLAILPLGTRLRCAGQFIAGTLSVVLFVPIPLVFVPMVSDAVYWPTFGLLWLTFFTVNAFSAISVSNGVRPLSEKHFSTLVYYVFGLFVAALAYSAATNRFSLVALDQAHAERDLVEVSGLQGYILLAFSSSFGGALFGMGIMLRKYYLSVVAMAGFVICYGILFERAAAIVPFWILYLFLSQRLFFRDSVLRFLMTLAAPFAVGVLILAIDSGISRTSLLYTGFTLANYRLYAVPAIAFNVYMNFFHMHPHTFWSHINLVSKFVSYPYMEPLPLVMSDVYHMGNYNGAFIETDGIAAAGPNAMPFAGLLFGLMLAALNSCMNGLNMPLCAILIAAPAVAFVDTGIGPGLITNGVAALAALMLFAPRDASWNMRYGAQAESGG